MLTAIELSVPSSIKTWIRANCDYGTVSIHNSGVSFSWYWEIGGTSADDDVPDFEDDCSSNGGVLPPG